MRNLAYLIVLSMIFIAAEVFSQPIEPEYKLINSNIEGIIKNLDSYRFGMINVYELNDISQRIEDMVKSYVGTQQQIKVDSSVIFRFIETYGQDCYNELKRNILSGNTNADLTDCYPSALEKDSVSLIIAPTTDFGGFKSAYLITTKNKNEKVKGDIIALVLSKERIDATSDLQMATDEKLIFTFIEMQAIKDPQDETVTLFSIMQNNLDQDNVTSVITELQGQGEKWYVSEMYGTATSLYKDEKNIDDNKDVQKTIRISDGQPFNYIGKNNELIVGPDLIAWRQYPYDPATAQQETATNDSLPKYGVELRYGIDAINYPAFWSERWTLSALWKSVKLGLILPKSGWSSVFTDLFSLERRFTTAGAGIAANFDFPFPVISSSGVFHINFGYVSGDADVSPFKEDNKERLDTNYAIGTVDPAPDYLIRAHGQLHYTFGMSIDENYMLRLGLGGTVYNVETWVDRIVEEPDENGDTQKKVVYANSKNETFGGVSAKVEFMTIKNSTPYGSSLQYFDETLRGNIWLQIPVSYNKFFLRFDLDGFFSLRKNSDTRPWEYNNKAIFIPMAKLIFVF